MDKYMVGMKDKYYLYQFSDRITLPTTTSEAKKGIRNDDRNTHYLTDPYLFEGFAWYSRYIMNPLQNAEEGLELVLERTRISHLWIDDRYVGSYDSLCTSHHYDITAYMTAATHKVTILIDNVNYPTKGGHMTSQDTQTNWNGITGEISLVVYHKNHLSDVKIYPDIDTKSIIVKARLKGDHNVTIFATVIDEGQPLHMNSYYPVAGEEQTLIYQLGDHAELWSEHHPKLYTLQLEVRSTYQVFDIYTCDFGLREFKGKSNHFTINRMRTFLRGKHEAMIFPMTGYAPTGVSEWLKVLQTSKEYGINHYRFHTCCPPKAAFIAADMLGIYMEPELPFWGTVTKPGDENHDELMQQYLIQEGFRILKEFGNHPSFVMMSLGNELWGDQATLNRILQSYKLYDSRHLFTQGSNNFQFSPCILDEEDFYCGVRFSRDRLFRGSYAMCDSPQGHIQTMRPGTEHNYDQFIRPMKLCNGSDNKVGSVAIQYGTGVKTVQLTEQNELIPKIPVVSHEIGQYCMFPNFKEIGKYKGVLQPENLKIFKERVAKTGLLHKAGDYFKASGSFAAMCYKEELETALRSRELAGFQILDIQDFTGQGTALVGILDAFMENKGIISSNEWRSFCSDAVLLAEFPRYTYNAGEVFHAGIKLAYYRPEPMNDVKVHVQMYEDLDLVYEKHWTVSKVPIGISSLGEVNTILKGEDEPKKLTLMIKLEEYEIKNQYSLWVYPKLRPSAGYGQLLVTSDLMKACIGLQEGKNVLFMPACDHNPNSIEGTYCTDFWNYTMFRSISEYMGKAEPIGTLGLSIDYKHPALSLFPSEAYTTPQWWDIIANSRSTILDSIEIEPIVQTIDNVERNHILGLVFELRVMNGNLLVCNSELKGMEYNEVQKWFFHSLASYASSEEFRPEQEISMDEFVTLYQRSK